MTFFSLEINFAAKESYAYPSVIAIISLKWAARIIGLLKWATAQKILRNTDLAHLKKKTTTIDGRLLKPEVTVIG